MDLITNRISPDYVKIALPLTLNGKFRWKKPNPENGCLDITCTTKTEPFTEDTYLEWQVGYDVPVSDADNPSQAKDTSLKKWTFFSETNVEKYPYEIAEHLLAAIKSGVIDEIELDKLIERISSFEETMEEITKPRLLQSSSKQLINGYSCESNAVILASTNFKIPNSKAYIRINTQKQQKGAGYQPMLYLCIPIGCLENGDRYIGKCAKTNEKGYLMITEKTQNILISTVELLASLSQRHKHDVLEILKILKKYIKEDE